MSVTPHDLGPIIDNEVEWGDWEHDGNGLQVVLGHLDVGNETACVLVSVDVLGSTTIDTYWYGSNEPLPRGIDEHLRNEAREKASEL